MAENTKNQDELSVDDILKDIRGKLNDTQTDAEQKLFGEESGKSIFESFEEVTIEETKIMQGMPEAEQTDETVDELIEVTDESEIVIAEEEIVSDDTKKEEKASVETENAVKTDDIGKTKVFDRKKINAGQNLSDRTLVLPTDEAESEVDELEKRFNEEQKEKIKGFRLNTEKLSDGTVYDTETDKALSVLDAAGELHAEDIFAAVEKVKKPKKENIKRNELIKQRNNKVYDKIDIGRVKLELKKDAGKNRTRMIILIAVFVLSVVAQTVKAIYFSGKLQALSSFIGGTGLGAYVVGLVLSLPALAVAFEMFFTRLRNSESFAFTSELSVLVLSAANVIHNVILTVKHEEITKNTLFFTSAVCFIAFINVMSDKKENKMISANLQTLMKNETLLGIYSLERDTNRLASGISDSVEPTILCAGEVEVPNSFMDSSTIKDKQNAYMKIVIPCMVAFSAVCAGVAFITYGSVTALSTAFISTLLMCSPAVLPFMLSSLLSNANTSLNRKGCEILGYEAVEYMDNVDAIVLDTAEVFSGEISRFHIINSRSKVNVRRAFEIACAVIIESGGVLSGEAEKLVKEGGLESAEVEDLKYEERLGISCWVSGKRTLLGTRRMMEEHNLAVPPAYTEEGYINDGKKVLYLAIDSQVVAMFCTEYFIGRQTKKQLEKLYKTGVILMLMTTDPNIDEDFVANTLGIDPSSIKMINSSGTESIKKSISETAKQKRTGLIYKRNVAGLLRVINTAFRLYDVQALSILIQTISIGFAFVIMAVLNLVATSSFVTFWLVIVYHILWTLLSMIMTSRAGND